jgi:hypothetical protein
MITVSDARNMVACAEKEAAKIGQPSITGGSSRRRNMSWNFSR